MAQSFDPTVQLAQGGHGGQNAPHALAADPPIRGQNFVLFSFCEPETSVIQDRELFIMKRFMDYFYEETLLQTVMKALKDATNTESIQQELTAAWERIIQQDIEDHAFRVGGNPPHPPAGAEAPRGDAAVALDEKQEFPPEQRSQGGQNAHHKLGGYGGRYAPQLYDAASRLVPGALQSVLESEEQDERVVVSRRTMRLRYLEFRAKYFVKLCHDFDEEQARQPPPISVEGVKCRGVFATMAEATAHAHKLRDLRVDPAVGIFVGEVGVWMPRNPSDEHMHVDYGNAQLQQLMDKRFEEMQQETAAFEARKQRLATGGHS